MPIVSTPAGSAGSLTLFSSTTLSGDGTFDVANIPATGNDLLLVFIGRGTRAAAADSLLLRLNNDSAAANYDSQRVSGSGATPAAAQTNLGGATGIKICEALVAATGTANRATTLECWIHGYAGTVFNKNAVAVGFSDFSADAGREVDVCSGTWVNTAAVSRVQLQGGTTANLLSGSSLRIYLRS